MNQEDMEQNEVDGMKKEADLLKIWANLLALVT